MTDKSSVGYPLTRSKSRENRFFIFSVFHKIIWNLKGVLNSYDIFISSDYGIKKPEKSYMELLLSKHHLQIRDCIMIGNELKSDIAVADSCGMDSLYFHSSSEQLPTKISATYYMADRSYKNFNHPYVWIRVGK